MATTERLKVALEHDGTIDLEISCHDAELDRWDVDAMIAALRFVRDFRYHEPNGKAAVYALEERLSPPYHEQ